MLSKLDDINHSNREGISMDDGLVVMMLMLFIIGVTIGILYTTNYYKQGQIDALTGKIKYRLIVNPDSTRTWERVGD